MSTVRDRFTQGFDHQIVLDWIADDPDPLTRAELQGLLEDAVNGDENARLEVEDRFAAPLSFGTAGLRGALGAGPNRMNRAVVIRAAAGLSHYLKDLVGPGFSVVIGCDARFGSKDFAHDTAAVVSAAGGRALLLPAELPTPVLAFALGHLGADAGVMVTASHNPPEDNGYKVYLGHRPLAAQYTRDGADPVLADEGAGAQIVPPFDGLIAEAIGEVASVASTERRDDTIEPLGDEVLEAYLQAIDNLGERASAELDLVVTSMHGVGAETAALALARTGFTRVHPVPEQSMPDPEFPTVSFPNPEEPGALDHALALAREVDADLVVAHDPDADRFSAAVPDPGTDAGWRQLTGDEVGLLLAEHLCSKLPADRTTPVTLANSIVSSRGLRAVAQAHGVDHRPTLTGFKWISRTPHLLFGYEEAIGYCVDPHVVKDKDGISASIVFASMASALAVQGRTVLDELRRIRERDGVFLTSPLTFRLADVSKIAGAMAQLRFSAPETLAGSPVSRVEDLAEGGELPPTDGIALHTAVGDRVIIRPSGTEPKLKCYLEAVEPWSETAMDEAAARLTAMKAELKAYFGL